jgi:hypothetical protein
MAGQPELPGIPETPESAKWAAWILHHFRQERDTMKGAPVFFLAVAAIGILLGYLVSAARFEDRTTTAEQRVQLANEQVTAYKEKLQGASPDQAAKQIEGLQTRLEALSKQMERTIMIETGRAARINPSYGIHQVPTESLPLIINVIMKNDGNISGSAPLHSGIPAYFDHLLEKKELDDLFLAALESAKPSRANVGTNKIQAGQATAYYSVTFPVVTKAVWDDVLKEKQFAYLLTILQYRDETTPQGKWRLTEGCIYISVEQSIHLCDYHNNDSLID